MKVINQSMSVVYALLWPLKLIDVVSLRLSMEAYLSRYFVDAQQRPQQ